MGNNVGSSAIKPAATIGRMAVKILQGHTCRKKVTIRDAVAI